MAKAELEPPFNSVSGKLSKDSEMYFTQRFGATVVSNYPKHKDPAKITDRQKARYVVFQQAVAEADIELTNPQRRAYWQEQFNAQKEPRKYKTFRGYVIAQLTNQISNENKEN